MTATLVHGTHNAYSNYRCRCQQCRAFKVRYNRARRQHRAVPDRPDAAPAAPQPSLKRDTDTYPRRP